jgi:hypothetical protein
MEAVFMIPIKKFYHWSKSVAKYFTHLAKPQASVLAGFSLGLALVRSCTLARIAEGLACLGKADTVERRLQRFLSNDKIDWQEGCKSLANWVLSSLVFSGQTLVLLVDETSLQEHLKVMAVSLAYRGRAIPLAWWCYPEEQYPMKQVKLIDTLLGWVAPYIPERCGVLVQADRGIGTSPGLLQLILKRGWHYLVRVILQGRKDSVTIRSLIERPGQQWSGWVKAFKKAGWQRCWAIAYWGPGSRGALALADGLGTDPRSLLWLAHVGRIGLSRLQVQWLELAAQSCLGPATCQSIVAGNGTGLRLDFEPGYPGRALGGGTPGGRPGQETAP